MAQDKIADRDKLLTEAWARWREADYSWEGLLDRRKEADGFESLQHYWRTDPGTGEVRDDAALIDAGELIVVAGQKTYHIAHLPLHYEDGSPTTKTVPETATEIHERLVNLIEVRLKVSSAEDSPMAMLQGIVIGSRIDLSLNRADYPLQVNFSFALIHEALFTGAKFLSSVSFLGTTFLDSVRFDNTTFSSYIRFDRATFYGDTHFDSASFLGDAIFSNATFYSRASFVFATFSCDACFDSAIYGAEAYFLISSFSGHTSFVRTSFSDYARFGCAKFSSHMNYTHAQFQKEADFAEVTWPQNPLAHHKAFFNATFEALADFSGSGFRAFAAFDGAIFKQGLRFDKIERSSATGKRRFEAQARHHLNNELAACKTESDDDFGPEQRLEELENGCRLLKQEMIKQGDKSREQILYKFELLARRAQKSTALSEKALSYLYGWFSDYGGSALRPLVWLVGIWLGFSLLFSTFLFSVSPPRPVPAPVALVAPASPNGSCKDALHLPAKASDLLPLSLSVSASRIFPFGAFEDVSKRLVSAYDCEGYTGRALGFRLLATVESFLALTLAFLFGLAVRRRFQIS